jgi:lysozyme family protein
MSDKTNLFNRCIEVVLKNEGGYVNHPKDPGGETNMGITKRDYPDLDIKHLSRNHAIMIYYNDYWSKMNLLSLIDDRLILHIFDMGVNAGPKTAIKMAQRIVEVKPDGIIGPETTEMINQYPGDLLNMYKQERRKYYFAIARRKPDLQVFLPGWLNRIDNTYFLS